jgi:hypothetical protein
MNNSIPDDEYETMSPSDTNNTEKKSFEEMERRACGACRQMALAAAPADGAKKRGAYQASKSSRTTCHSGQKYPRARKSAQKVAHRSILTCNGRVYSRASGNKTYLVTERCERGQRRVGRLNFGRGQGEFARERGAFKS